MYIIFISNSVLKSKRRCEFILDRYATRINPNTWGTKITQEGLNTIKYELSEKANKHMSVSCYKNSKNNMKHVWHIGNTKYSYNNSYFIKNHSIKPNLFCLVSSISGLCHDLGKYTSMFQEKIRGNTDSISDPVRHEWISSFIIEKCIFKGFPKTINDIDNYYPSCNEISSYIPLFLKEPPTKESVIIWIVNSHHKLCGAGGFLQTPDNRLHVRKTDNSAVVTKENLVPIYSDFEKKELFKIFKRIESLYKRIKRIHIIDNELNKLMLISRAGLILADHTISSLNVNSKYYNYNVPVLSNVNAYANTCDNKLNQPLHWHLRNVSRESGKMTYRILKSFSTCGLSDNTVDNIIQETNINKYKWQDSSYNNVLKCGDDPMFLVNCASTGKGKTRANAKFAMGINKTRGKQYKMIVALNLRSLTLQTGNEYKGYWDAIDDELACIVGDNLIRKLNNVDSEKVRYDEEDEWVYYDVVGGSNNNMHSYLKHVSNNKPYVSQILNSSVLVSTIDFIINAGNPGKQAHNALSLLKIKDNILILDEIDSYDPDALVDIAKTMEVAGMLNCDVILSSATIPCSIIKMMFNAFNSGVKSTGQNNITGGFIDEYNDQFNVYTDVESIIADYTKFIDIKVVYPPTKKYKIIDLDKKIFEYSRENRVLSYFNTIKTNIYNFHNNVCFNYNDIKVSFGAVRFANIKPLINFCNFMGETYENNEYQLKICAYHSADIVAHRYHKERRLDYLLTRKNSSQNIHNDPEIHEITDIAKKEGKKHVIFIVVASPVEEVGRDHDFDWGILELSSMHSFVQFCGRINRHREIEISSPNIGLLDYNYKCVYNNNNNRCFIYPGLEKNTNFPHSSHDLMCHDETYINRTFRFDECNDIIQYEEDELNYYNAAITTIIKKESSFFGKEFHKKYNLRGNNYNFIYSEHDGGLAYLEKLWKRHSILQIDTSNYEKITWLNKDYTSYQEISENLSEDEHKKFKSVTLTSKYNITGLECVNYYPWGFRLENEK